MWIHAVSVGAVQAAASLVQALRAAWPDLSLTVTSATPAGRERARALFGTQVDVRYGPYDLPWCVRGTLRRARPAMLLIMETEIWPNLLAECAAAAVPVIFMSARLSARSAARLRAFGSLLRPALESGVAVVAQTVTDAGRFESLGVPAEHIEVGGNLKFDREPAALGVATLSGPPLGNAPEVARLLSQGGGLRIVRDAAELATALRELLGDDAARARLAAAGHAAVNANRGALKHLLERIRVQLARAPVLP